MNPPLHTLVNVVLLGAGATLTFDLAATVLKVVFKVPPSNICLVGRWLSHMPGGTFAHANISGAERKTMECAIGWMAHYLIGTGFALAFVAVVGQPWLNQPTPIPALLFGIVTVLAPFLIMQPAMGLGVAATRAPNPGLARIRSLLNHLAFGLGLYLTAVLANALLGMVLSGT